MQGEFGTWYLLSVLQCQSMLLSEFYPPQNVIDACYISHGIFACRFWHLGRWQVVLVDDYVPSRKSRNQAGMIYAIGAECRDGKSIFLPIVEKAHGKLLSYAYRTWDGARYAAADILRGACAAVRDLQAPEASLMPMVLKIQVTMSPTQLAGGPCDEPAASGGRLFLSFYFERHGCLIGSYLEGSAHATAEPSSVRVFTGTGSYKLDVEGAGGGEAELTLRSVQHEAGRETVRLGLQQLEAWRDSRSAETGNGGDTEVELVPTSEVCGILIDWIVNVCGEEWLPWADDTEESDTDQLSCLHVLTGGQLLLRDTKEGLLDMPGALLRWWSGGEQPGRVWSSSEARWVGLNKEMYGTGPDAFERLVQTVQTIESVLKEDMAITSADTDYDRTTLRGQCSGSCGVSQRDGH